MERFRVRLEACDPVRGRFRTYRTDAGGGAQARKIMRQYL
jgi:hypothetical protein